MRIAVAGIAQESLTFNPLKMFEEDFRLWRGEQVLEYPGLAAAVQELEIEPVPIFAAQYVTPGGIVDEGTYLRFRGEILDGIRRAGPLDGICLMLHGALVVENIWSGETDLVRSIRAEVGYDVPISAMLDLHAQLTEEFANKTDIWTPFRTAPHSDREET